MSKPDVIVIGAGAAGILASYTAAMRGAKVLLLEKTDRVGTKILVSGGGKCNITHDGPIEDVLRAYPRNEAQFLRPSFYCYPNTEIVDMLTAQGLRVYTRPNGRIFPVDQTAKDVCRILHQYLLDVGVEIQLSTRVLDIEPGFVIHTNQGDFESEQIILSVGGKSFPKTGTTGDGYPWVTKLGHTLAPIRAALAPMEMNLEGLGVKAGVALRDVVLKGRVSGKEIARWRDDLLFTHRGVSGPTVLGVAREVALAMETGSVLLEVDLCPDQSFEQVSAKLQTWKSKNPNQQLAKFLEGLVPNSVVEGFAQSCGIEPADKAQELGKKELNRLVEAIKGWKLGEVGEVVMEKGEVVAGGVELGEVDPHTMESRVCPGLHLCGEILDVAGPVGGYNLQAAWSTGFVAGDSISFG
ncbi:MAG: NAD(P)/FAD-dependent oxidoreductase [Armatimonadetes bacterium]|nr:NAD(P)/FAD-dependent oxidoreductase [Armatimonadota bacterium]